MHVMIETVIFIGIDLVAIFKLYTLFYHQLNSIYEITERLEGHFPHSGNNHSASKVNNHLKRLKLFHNIQFFTYNLTLLQFTTTPFLHQIYGRLASTHIDMEQIFTLSISDYQFNLYAYPFIYIFEAWFAYFAVHFVRCSDMLFACLVQILAMEFDIVGQKLSEIDPTQNEEEAIEKVKKLIDVHQELIEISEKIDEIIGPMQLINAFCSIAALCSASFLVVVSCHF